MSILFNDGWKYSRLGENNFKSIAIPHDAMIYEERSLENKGGTNNSYFAGLDYEYVKEFDLPENWRGKKVVIEFEGIMMVSNVFVNDVLVSHCDYGYEDIYADITCQLKEGKNIIRVVAINHDQPNSRWYTGAGIYRDVSIHLLPMSHILVNGIKIKTVDYKEGRISANIKTNTPGTIDCRVLYKDEPVTNASVSTDGDANVEIVVPNAKLWSTETPELYELEVNFNGHIVKERFGIRTVHMSKEEGLTINGERVILKGACFHHDNGLIGARSHKAAEYRKVRIHKEAGYNALRSAHNPCSKNILNACDEMGILVMDEYADAWYIHKTQFDCASFAAVTWKEGLKNIVDKDFNHPSVILYSTGNEVAETGEKRGIELTKSFTEYLHELDDTRYVSCGVNIFFNYLYSLGFGVYSDKKAEKTANSSSKKKKQSVGSEFFNDLAGLLGAGFMKFGATLHGSNVKTRDAFANMDAAGYNYGINRYKRDLKHYPNRMILGSETFCSDAYKFMTIARNNPRLIGDFVWAGFDYLGEVGIGSWTTGDYCDNDFSHQVGWLTAGSGRIDITGKLTSESDYTRVVFGLDPINMGVIPPYHYKKRHSPSSWKFSRAERSWNYPGCEGLTTEVEVYAECDHITLALNGKKLATKKMHNDARTIFKVKYQPGELKAISYDKTNNVLAEVTLNSGGSIPTLRLEPEAVEVGSDGLVYVRMRYTDENGMLISSARGDIKIEKMENLELVGFGHGGAYNKRGYITDVSDTNFGEALAVFAPIAKGKASIECSSPFGNASTTVEII
ncbi:MAG: DUF4982 domain-containing protein [Bacilli bacterium]|nr:DUF4982 domain-containing protein [Bacilli bacterium]